MTAPLVVTLAVDDDVQRRWDDERRRWFPSGRTQVGAHVTLFHAVPGELEADVRDGLAAVGGSLAVRVAEVVSLGRGAAYRLVSEGLTARHRRLQQAWWPHLTPQDRQPFRPHVTVQNKVEPVVARRTVEDLRAAFSPYEITAVGLDLWRYDGGPWTHLARFAGD